MVLKTASLLLRSLTGWLLPIILAIILAAIAVNESKFFQRINGSLNPVVTRLIPDRIEPIRIDELDGVLIAGSAIKLRRCTYSGIEFHLGGWDGVPIPSRFLDPVKTNSVGGLHWDGLFIGITQDRLFEVYGEVLHTCSFGIKVLTPFYIGADKTSLIEAITLRRDN